MCLQHLLKPNYDVVKRWVNEAQEAVSSDNNMVQVRTYCKTKKAKISVFDNLPNLLG